MYMNTIITINWENKTENAIVTKKKWMAGWPQQRNSQLLWARLRSRISLYNHFRRHFNPTILVHCLRMCTQEWAKKRLYVLSMSLESNTLYAYLQLARSWIYKSTCIFCTFVIRVRTMQSNCTYTKSKPCWGKLVDIDILILKCTFTGIYLMKIYNLINFLQLGMRSLDTKEVAAVDSCFAPFKARQHCIVLH